MDPAPGRVLAEVLVVETAMGPGAEAEEPVWETGDLLGLADVQGWEEACFSMF